MYEMKNNKNYPCVWTLEETPTSLFVVGFCHHLNDTVLTMHAFRPVFLAVVVVSKRLIPTELTLTLLWKIFNNWFSKLSRT